jgi:glycosyltransferase involved in cell wall biosynthesis
MYANDQENITISPPLVSVVMCSYNGEKFLQPQIDSILAQTYPNIELVIVDDASSDNTVSILEEYKKRDNRVRYYVNEKNLGYNKNFEKAFSLASGEHIAISDQDDIWEINKIELMMKDWPADTWMIYCLSGSFHSDHFEKREPGKLITKDGKITHLYELFFSGHMHGHACMFKKELLRHSTPFPTDLFYDAWLSFYAVSLGPIHCIPSTLVWHRSHESNSSGEFTSIKDKVAKGKKLRKLMIDLIERFCTKGAGNEQENSFLLEYARLLKPMNGKKFHASMFRFIMKNRKLVFHYKKKKPFIYISHLKHALRMGRKGLL